MDRIRYFLFGTFSQYYGVYIFNNIYLVIFTFMPKYEVCFSYINWVFQIILLFFYYFAQVLPILIIPTISIFKTVTDKKYTYLIICEQTNEKAMYNESNWPQISKHCFHNLFHIIAINSNYWRFFNNIFKCIICWTQHPNSVSRKAHFIVTGFIYGYGNVFLQDLLHII